MRFCNFCYILYTINFNISFSHFDILRILFIFFHLIFQWFYFYYIFMIIYNLLCIISDFLKIFLFSVILFSVLVSVISVFYLYLSNLVVRQHVILSLLGFSSNISNILLLFYYLYYFISDLFLIFCKYFCLALF